ncbi:TonB-dependent receptor plug domain-containing protein [Nitrosomonas aestuarii]|uniref:TonB-dependent receptor plug domain-containing protein n=1 Tax=Nitrosomonas aestuarii TaxID=52441 RepID=UPI001BA60ED8|nr:TonB-dependent receptor [Nitrosomonas aestuarii]
MSVFPITIFFNVIKKLVSHKALFVSAIFASTSIQAKNTENTPLKPDQIAVQEVFKKNAQLRVVFSEVLVTGRADTLVGIADSASQGNVGQAQLKYRPIIRPGEVLEAVPGFIATQHSGEGKANQYFLRGFNLDHGTDFLTQIEGVPVNQTAHSHGQGWTDTNFLIPELIETLEFKKGNYYADTGDFSSAGSANIRYFNRLPENIIRFTGGSFDYYRGLIAGSRQLGKGELLYAGEVVHNDGPWTTGNNYLKLNGVLRYSREYQNHSWHVTAMATQSDWRSTDQIPRRKFKQGAIGRFDALDPTDGGNNQRYSLTGEWNLRGENSLTAFMAYGVYSKLNLYSNFSFFLDDNETVNPVGCGGISGLSVNSRVDPVLFNTCGDQIGQPDDRWTTGFKGSHTLFHKIGSFDSEPHWAYKCVTIISVMH